MNFLNALYYSGGGQEAHPNNRFEGEKVDTYKYVLLVLMLLQEDITTKFSKSLGVRESLHPPHFFTKVNPCETKIQL